VRKVVGAALLGRCPDDEEQDVFVAVVSELERSPRLDDTDRASGKLHALRRVAKIDGGIAFQHDKQLFLDVLGVALPASAGRIPPEAGSRIRQGVRDRGKRTSAAVSAVDELELSGVKDRVRDT